MRPEASGVTGFYGPRAADAALLQPAELVCAAFVERHLAEAEAVYEIGCGLGVLTTVLALRGFRAIGVERNPARAATADNIARAVLDQLAEGPARPAFVSGEFPHALRRARRLASSAALVTNLVGTASEEQKARFIRGLRAFGAVLIDVRRFYDRRSTGRQVRELEQMFTLLGFEPPRLAFDLGREGRYVLFVNNRPSHSPGPEAMLAAMGVVCHKPIVTPA